MEVLRSGAGSSTSRVWIENHPTEGWAPGNVDSVGSDGKYVVVDEHGEQFRIPQEKARPVDPACLRGVEDLLALGDFNEGALLHDVRVRYFRDEIYTGIGGPILISMNPFQDVRGLYSEQKQKFYRDRASAGSNEFNVPPHLFSVGASAHMAMLSDSKNQSIIISGESGAGKTEATKRILAYFANLQRTNGGSGVGEGTGADRMSIEDQVLRSNPILEAFGNAKTVRNDNSSRFGKYIDIEFDTRGKLQSAVISNYLLEKVRIVQQQPNERGYHAFYQLCAGASNAGFGNMLHLRDSSEHNYTYRCTEIPNVDDADNFQEMLECMDSLGFSTEEKNSVFKITAAVLHLGDLEFAAHEDTANGTKITDSEQALQISEMFRVQIKDFTKVFQFKTLEDPFTKKIIDMPQDEAGASNTRHSMAKTVYGRLFDWLVWRINQSTMAKNKAPGKAHKIGILDIYGFEVFEWNSFEQLCINFANEKLQQHFNSHMFTLEQQLYTEEGITWSHITWQDNREIIDSLERKPLGLFCILDSECLMPNATDPTCLNKIYNSFKTSKIVYKPSRFASTNFAVAHYAGEVIYDIISFLEKNTDKLHADIINMMRTSSMTLLKSLFSDARFAPEVAAIAGGNRPAAKARTVGSVGRAGGDGGRAKQNVTVSMMFRQQLDQLVEDLNKTNPRYIRCIKPNANKQAHDFDSLDVQRQLRCAGMLESIRIRRAGYSVRRPFKEFVNRFRVLCPSIMATGMEPDFKELSRNILTNIEATFARKSTPIEPKSWQIGRSKVFLKEDLQTKLEGCIAESLKKFVVLIQKKFRGYRQRKRYKTMRKAAALLQSGLRTMRAVTEYRESLKKHQATVTLQTNLRMAFQRLVFVQKRAGILRIQRICRGWLARKRIGKLKGKRAAERIQRMREDEERKRLEEERNKALQEKEKTLEDMQRKFMEERERAQEEARAQIEENRKATVFTAPAAVLLPPATTPLGSPCNSAREDGRRSAASSVVGCRSMGEFGVADAQWVQELEQDASTLRKENTRLQMQLDSRNSDAASKQQTEIQQELDQLRREHLELRKENARLEGMLECRGPTPTSGASPIELAELRRELQDMRRDKVRLEVEMATAKSAEEYDALSAETCELREERSVLRRAKLDAEVQLDQKVAQIEFLQTQISRSDSAMVEAQNLNAAHEELQIQFQRVQAQKNALEERSRGGEAARNEIRELRLEKMRLEGELEMAQLKESEIAKKLKNFDKTAQELKDYRLRLTTTESELEVSRKNVEGLREQLAQHTKDENETRNSSLDLLRTELMSRIESSRPSALPVAEVAIVPEFAEEKGERKTLLDQRAMFETIRQQFNNAKALDETEVKVEEEPARASIVAASREAEHDEEIRRFRKEIVELNIRIESLQDDLRDKTADLSNYTRSSASLQADVLDLNSQLEHDRNFNRRQAADIADLQQRAIASENESNQGRQLLIMAQKDLVKAEEEAKNAQMRQRMAEDELPGMQRRVQELQAQLGDAQARIQTSAAQIDEQRLSNEQLERTKMKVESNLSWLESENERLKFELQDANNEKLKIKGVVEDLMRADAQNKSEELEREIEKYKGRAAYFEREYNNSKQLNNEMTKLMSQMSQAAAVRSDGKSDLAQQNRLLQKQVEAKSQELRLAKHDRDEAQKEVDALHSTGALYQNKYREAQDELRILKQDHSIAAATNLKFKMRVECLQKEAEDLKSENAKLCYEMRATASDQSKIDRYESHVKDIEEKLSKQAEELDRSQAFGLKSQAVNDCLNTLLVLESEHTSLYESNFSVDDAGLLSEFVAKKTKAQDIVGRLNAIMSEEERPSIAYIDKRYS